MASLGDVIRLLAAPVGNHLWQSTLFGLAAACTPLLLKKNEARLRFWVWFLASAKFLLPFALLLHIGSNLGAHLARPSQASFASVVEFVAQPFEPSRLAVTPTPTWWDQVPATLPIVIATIWLAGTLTVLAVWFLRWLQIFRTTKAAHPLASGPEFDLLQSVARESGAKALPILVSESHTALGVFGIVRPVLLWPANISQELTESELKAILAHEAWHVRRHDNLTGAIQMFIEAIFWFHPLVWWFGWQQIEERERACDEGVLGMGSVPAVYAEGILKTCRFCVEAQLACVAGVQGSNLKKRITRIMKMQNIAMLSRARKIAFLTLATGAIAAPVLFGILSAPKVGAQTSDQAASSGPLRVTAIKRNTSGSVLTQIKRTGDETFISNATARNLIELAYSIKDYQLTGGPAWVGSDRFDISFAGGSSSALRLDNASSAAIKEMLAQEFHLVMRQETRSGQVFALVVSDGGPKFSQVTPEYAPGTKEPLLRLGLKQENGEGRISITGGPGGLADALSSQVGRPIIDKTGLTGIYSINFHWATASASADTITSDLQQQLGLSLTPQEGPVETSIIDTITMPTSS
jgi:uncharacterized protein (TIGR03435 family)